MKKLQQLRSNNNLLLDNKLNILLLIKLPLLPTTASQLLPIINFNIQDTLNLPLMVSNPHTVNNLLTVNNQFMVNNLVMDSSLNMDSNQTMRSNQHTVRTFLLLPLPQGIKLHHLQSRNDELFIKCL